jgi:ribosomal protein S18 acetylase RimI-like enzyme
MITIARLPPERWQDYQSLRLEALKNEPAAFGSSYEEEVTLAKEVWQKRIGNALFAVVKDKPVGMVVFVFSDRIKTKHIANIYGMYVNKAFRNQGIGSQLLSIATANIKENNGILKIKLSVNPAQKSAIKLYNKFGFTSIGTSRKEYNDKGNFSDEVLMEKFL